MRYICEIPDSVYNALKYNWDWIRGQGLATISKTIADDWFEFFIKYTEDALTYYTVQEFQYFCNYNLDLIVDFVEDIVESNSKEWADAIATIVASGSELADRIEEIDDQETYMDVYVKIFEWSLPSDSALELLGEIVAAKLKESSIEIEDVKSINIDIEECILVINTR